MDGRIGWESLESEAAAAVLCGLVERMARADQAALGELRRVTLSLVSGVVRKAVFDARDAEEIVADVYYTAWTHAGSYSPLRAPVAGWLAMIARSKSVDCIRRTFRERRKVATSADGGCSLVDVDERENVALQAETNCLCQAARRAMDDLCRDRKSVIELLYFDGLTSEEVSTRTGLAIGTVKSHARRALASLKRTMETPPLCDMP